MQPLYLMKNHGESKSILLREQFNLERDSSKYLENGTKSLGLNKKTGNKLLFGSALI